MGNAPHTVLISADGQTAYVSNEGGRVPTEKDFQIYSGSSEIVADPFIGAAVTGTVSVVDVPTLTLKATINTDLHPTGMAFYGRNRLLVADAYSELVKRFPLFDNFYDPSRQSADGHQWITEGLAPYSDDIQSPDWNRSSRGTRCRIRSRSTRALPRAQSAQRIAPQSRL